MSKTTANKLEANAALVAAITQAVQTAAAGGLSTSDISAALARVQELLAEEG
jgi:hypothetical protein